MDDDELTPTWSAAACAAAIRRAGLAMRLAGFVQFIGWIPTLWLREVLAWRGLLNRDAGLEPLLALQVLLCVILGAWIGVAGRSAQWLESPARVRRGAYLALLPVSAAALVTMPVGLWMLYLLRQPEVLEEFLKSEKKAVAERIFQEESLLQHPFSESPWYSLGWIVAHAWQRILILAGGLTCTLLALGPWVVSRNQAPGLGLRLDDSYYDGPHRLVVGVAGLLLVIITCATFKKRHAATRSVAALVVCTTAILAAGALVLSLNSTPFLRTTPLPYITAFIGLALGFLGMRELQQGGQARGRS